MISLQLSRTAAALRRQPALASSLARPAADSLLPGRQSQRPFGGEAGGDCGDDGGKLYTDGFVKMLAMNRGITPTAAREALDGVVDCITEVTATGRTVSIAKFGKFEPVVQKARSSQINPQDPRGARLHVPEKRRVKFRPYKHFSGVMEGTIEHKRRSGKERGLPEEEREAEGVRAAQGAGDAGRGEACSQDLVSGRVW